MALRLTVLDVAGMIEDTVALAPHVEQLGYERYWIAEHQPQPAPTLVSAIVAGLTQQIRVGTAGILFHYYWPKRVAHDFHFLERAFEGRIDAGFSGGIVAHLTDEDLEGRDEKALYGAYPERVERLVRHLRNTPGNPAFDEKAAWIGALDDPPQIWSLGSGQRSADLAARFGLYLGYALLYRTSVDDPQWLQHYRATFHPDRTQPAPKTIVAVCGSCAPTKAEAEALTAPLAADFFLPRVVGDPAECVDQLRAIADRYGTDEIVFADRIMGLDDRKRCYELLAEALAR